MRNRQFSWAALLLVLAVGADASDFGKTMGGGGGGGGGSTITTGTFAGLPGCASAGDLYAFSDSGYEYAYCDGSDWHYYRDGLEMYPPALGSFAWVNQGGATATTTHGGIYLTAPAAGGPVLRVLVKAAPATPYTIDVVVLTAFQGGGTPSVCAVWRESATQEIVGNCAVYQLDGFIKIWRWDDATSFDGTYEDIRMQPATYTKLILRIEDDGSNRKCYYSVDGGVWILVHSVGNTDFLTADQVGFSVNAGDAAWAAQARFLSFHEQ